MSKGDQLIERAVIKLIKTVEKSVKVQPYVNISVYLCS